ncbi:hypothetical protein GOQ27_00625 [Clostridium sp. D2Q-11]|uniref:SatD family (SatD) n=1 Tax=Anaeromonas frigoriresistens TaxID=2683708 RepID=A0A942UYS0_9FIRM|nr:SatD family protein [Anaeromonas frigoriresistens]MBS4536942.1 hypothetical protein [Anaeromonas frigoriresistens]
MEYMTIIFDIKNSKNLNNREEVQYQLIDTIEKANDYFSSSLVSSFIITLGDEWQGLFTYPCDYNDIINFFKENLVDIDFYCGIGIGDISVHNFTLTVNQLDGPSFHRARKAISIAKKNNYSLVLLQ